MPRAANARARPAIISAPAMSTSGAADRSQTASRIGSRDSSTRVQTASRTASALK
jgi:hypothetical protein